MSNENENDISHLKELFPEDKDFLEALDDALILEKIKT